MCIIKIISTDNFIKTPENLKTNVKTIVSLCFANHLRFFINYLQIVIVTHIEHVDVGITHDCVGITNARIEYYNMRLLFLRYLSGLQRLRLLLS